MRKFRLPWLNCCDFTIDSSLRRHIKCWEVSSVGVQSKISSNPLVWKLKLTAQKKTNIYTGLISEFCVSTQNKYCNFYSGFIKVQRNSNNRKRVSIFYLAMLRLHCFFQFCFIGYEYSLKTRTFISISLTYLTCICF